MSRVLSRLRAALLELSPVLRRVAQYVLDNPNAVIYHSVTEFAEATQSSEGSIIRFCKDMGYSGFQEFKLSLAVELNSVARPRRESAGADTELIEAIAESAGATVQETVALFEPQAVKEVATRLLAASRVDIYGVAASGIIAQYYAYKLMRVGITVQAFVDTHLATMSASNLKHVDVAIGVSSSGSTLDTLQALTVAREAGAYTVAITNRLRSPMSRIADQSLLASPPESPLTGGDIFSKISQLLILEALIETVLSRDDQRRHAVRRTAEVVVEKSV